MSFFIHYEDKLIKKSKAVCAKLCQEDLFGDFQGWFNPHCSHYHFALGHEYFYVMEGVGQKEWQVARTEKGWSEDEGKSHPVHLDNKSKTKSYTQNHKRPNNMQSNPKKKE